MAVETKAAARRTLELIDESDSSDNVRNIEETLALLLAKRNEVPTVTRDELVAWKESGRH